MDNQADFLSTGLRYCLVFKKTIAPQEQLAGQYGLSLYVNEKYLLYFE